MPPPGDIPVRMLRDSLQGLPDHLLPVGYSLRWYTPGDERHWVRIQRAADKHNEITPELFVEDFGTDPDITAQRQCFLCDSHGAPIGTATAWFDRDYHGAACGLVHWVAILPRMQGKGLSKPLMSVVLRRMQELGHDRACIVTSAVRIPALNLYLQFGFRPEIRSCDDLHLWKHLRGLLKKPLGSLSIEE